jgi:hypothetical protein
VEGQQTTPDQTALEGVDGEGATDRARRGRRPVWGLLVVVAGVIAVAVLFVVGFTGLFANPVKGVNPDGTTTLSGSFEPYQCTRTACDGYIQAGARSVFVVFPSDCAPPERGATITVIGRSAADLGSGSYRATACP